MKSDFKNNFLFKIENFVYQVYQLSDKFPKEELYCLTSQLRRAILSVIANIYEGYARHSTREYLRYLNISFGSLAESKFFIRFAYKRKYLSESEFKDIWSLIEEASKMIWSAIDKLKNRIRNNNEIIGH